MSAVDQYGRVSPENAPPAAHGVNGPVVCTGCGFWVEPLSVFPQNRCQLCHGNDPVVRAELAAMTGESLAKMWGAK